MAERSGQFVQYAMIIGAMKAGTTSLFDLLVRDPRICGSQPKEPEFFSRRQGHKVAVRSYEELFAFDPARHRVCLEASTGYTKYPSESDVPERIAQAGLSPRFIYVTRDPVRRIESHMAHAGIGLARLSEERFAQLLAVSAYHMQVSRFAKLFGKESILVVDFDEVLHDTGRTVERILAHVGLAGADFDLTLPHSNESRTTLRDWIRQSGLAHVYDLLPGWCDRALDRLVLRRIAARVRYGLDESRKARVRESLRDDVALLAQEYGFRASWMDSYLGPSAESA